MHRCSAILQVPQCAVAGAAGPSKQACRAHQLSATVGAVPVVKRCTPCRAPFLLAHFLFLPPSYTHRHCCELARAPGGSCAGGPFPPRPFVWEILKIDCHHTNCSQSTHADFYLCHACMTPPGSGRETSAGSGKALGAQKVRMKFADLPYIADLPTYPIHLLTTQSNLPTYPIHLPTTKSNLPTYPIHLLTTQSNLPTYPIHLPTTKISLLKRYKEL
jgi:hypothetical protein